MSRDYSRHHWGNGLQKVSNSRPMTGVAVASKSTDVQEAFKPEIVELTHETEAAKPKTKATPWHRKFWPT